MGLRDRRQERREERRGGDGLQHFQMRQKLASIGDDYWIENDRGERVYKVDGKALRVRQTLIFEDADGHRIAMVKQALITPLRDRWSVQIEDGPDLEIQGNIVDHEYTFKDGHDDVATVSKKWFRIADTYGVEVAPSQNPIVVLAATVVLDMMAHEGR